MQDWTEDLAGAEQELIEAEEEYMDILKRIAPAYEKTVEARNTVAKYRARVEAQKEATHGA